jgi:serine/threonine protein kinase/tetratricopeptide (TPR) repeat protein
MALTPGARLGTYEIVSLLGRGGMGEVYRARDTRLGREVAIKVLPAGVAADAGRLARFEREARTVAVLNHPNIVVLYSVEDEDGVRFLTMELVEGESLDLQVVPGGLPVMRVLELGIALADALAAAHARGVVHRDLKPANVILTREGRVKVLDFGLAKLASESPESALQGTGDATVASPLSHVGQIMGTVPYMAPEQVRGETTDARTDLFALGVLLYEMATGRRPFTGATSADVGSAILRDAPEPLTRVRPELPADLDRVVSRCLEKDPNSRVQTALDVCNELRRVKHALETAGAPMSAKPASRGVASIAVLPFVNRSRDEDDEYFSDGLADELLGMLAKIRGLRVAARTSSYQFKGTTDALSVIGQKLGVATLLEGSVRKSGNRVRISVQLVNVADGYHLWSETYDRTLEDIFAVQDDIAQSVVKELRTALLGVESDSKASGEAKAAVAAAARGRGSNPEAHRLYLQGRFLADRRSTETLGKAEAYLREALELEPEFARAWACLADVLHNQVGLGAKSAAVALPPAREAAARALELAPDLPEALEAQAGLQTHYDWNWPAAEVTVKRMLEVAPDSPNALSWASQIAGTMGRFDEAIALGRRACEQDPLSARGYMQLGLALQAARLLPEAEVAFRKVTELAPERAAVHNSLALLMLETGRLEEAMIEAQAERERIFRVQTISIVAHAMGRTEEADAALAELIRLAAVDGPFQVAEVYALRGDADAAFQWLDRAYDAHDPGLAQSRASSCMVRLHGDPRWGAMMRKMRLEA